MNAYASLAHTSPRIVNGLSVDVEDWFQVGASGGALSREDWDGLTDRVADNVERLIDLFSQARVSATFFVSGSFARRRPDIVRRIAQTGHEVASHGWDHARVWTQDRKEFASDIGSTRAILEDCTGQRVNGYRAPSFSIDHRCPWAYEELAQQGYHYSSSVMPVAHENFGWSGAPRFAFRPLSWSALVELPLATTMLHQMPVPAGGGGAFRKLPYGVSRWAIRRLNRRERRPAVFYCNPQEIDPQQPRIPGIPAGSRLRRSAGIRQMADRLRYLVEEFHWDRMDHLARSELPGACRFPQMEQQAGFAA